MSDRGRVGQASAALNGRLRNAGRPSPAARHNAVGGFVFVGNPRPVARTSQVRPALQPAQSPTSKKTVRARAQFIRGDMVRRTVLDAVTTQVPKTKPVVSQPVHLRKDPMIQRSAKAEAKPTVQIIQPEPFVKPALPKQQRSEVLKRQFVRVPEYEAARQDASEAQDPTFTPAKKRTKLQLAMVGMALFVFVMGLAVSAQTVLTNKHATAQVAALSKKTDQAAGEASADGTDDDATAPSTVKPTAAAVANYAVSSDLARYIKIPKLQVSARVLQTGVTSTGALGTPNNVFDTAWYTGSSKPGQPGATLIDGHVSSWTTKGVFYGIKTLVAGDTIQIVKGDGSVINYKVVKTQLYDAKHVDMQAAVTPVVPGKSGLNLITCSGDVIKGTSEFNKRVIVFATQV